MAKVIIDLNPVWWWENSHSREGTLTIQSGAIRFSAKITTDDLVRLMVGESVHLDADFTELNSSDVRLDIDTLAMPTQDENGVRLEAKERKGTTK